MRTWWFNRVSSYCFFFYWRSSCYRFRLSSFCFVLFFLMFSFTILSTLAMLKLDFGCSYFALRTLSWLFPPPLGPLSRDCDSDCALLELEKLAVGYVCIWAFLPAVLVLLILCLWCYSLYIGTGFYKAHYEFGGIFLLSYLWPSSPEPDISFWRNGDRCRSSYFEFMK